LLHPHLPPITVDDETDWSRNRGLVKRGFHDLTYLPRSRSGWNLTLSALAYSARRPQRPAPDLNLWAAMHGVAGSERYRLLGESALVLWHGTTAERADRIREVGLFHRRGLWTTLEPQIAHSYTRNRSSEFQAGSAMVLIVLDRREIQHGVHYQHEGKGQVIYRFSTGISSDSIEYILRSDCIEQLGEKARSPRPWGVSRFKKSDGAWVPRSRPPVRLDSLRTYTTLDEWLHISVIRILQTLGSATAIEVFASIYATLDPWPAIQHEAILNTLDGVADLVGKKRCGRAKVPHFALKPEIEEELWRGRAEGL